VPDLFEQLQESLRSSYVLEREIGRGGMATVYLARDIKHDRHVAVKVLNPELGAVLGVERFLSEIKVTANLQHPNLLPLFDSGDADGHLYYVMPYVEGESLRARLERERQLPVDEAVRIAIAAANALDYAHSHGVIHRDLKPENILIQHGQPVIADFGIALAISNAGGSRVTQTGLSLGTPQYMSPEQATGDRVIDGRSDIYSLGAILYEMLAGEPPHVGGTVQATISKVLTDPVRPLRNLRDTVPVQVELAVAKALAKLPADRFSSAALFVRALEGDRTGLAATAFVPAGTRRAWIRHPASIALAVLLVATSAIAAFKVRPNVRTSSDVRTVRFDFVPPPDAKLRLTFGAPLAVSPDGRTIAYVGEGPHGAQLWIRDLESGASRALPGTDEPESPAFSPDGRWIVFRMGVRAVLAKVPAGGGGIEPLYTATAFSRITFLTNDSLVFSTSNAGTVWGHLFAGSLAGGAAKPFLLSDSTGVSSNQTQPALAPDGKTLLFTSASAGRNTGRVIAWATRAGRVAVPTDVQANTILGYTAGHVIYANDAGTIMAVPFDLASHRVTGQPVSTGESAMMDVYSAKAALSESGDLVFAVGGGPVRPMLVDRSGARPLMTVERAIGDARYSPDGSRIAFSIRDAGRTDIWVYTVSSGSLDRITAVGSINDRVEWTPDGRRVVFRSDREGVTSLWWQAVDGSSPAERITPKTLDLPVLEGVVTPDGKTVVFRIDTPNRSRDILSVPIAGDTTVTSVLATDADELSPRISPDGKWMAYISAESGQDEVYVRPFPGPGGRVLVSVNGGREPLWSRDGRTIFYSSGGAYIAAAMAQSAAPTVTRRDTVATGSYSTWRFHPLYDIAPDGKHLLLLEPSQRDVPATVILNWAKAFAARVGPDGHRP
jgi:serine/threonine protein kinase/Tol biopolymer transport system component